MGLGLTKIAREIKNLLPLSPPPLPSTSVTASIDDPLSVFQAEPALVFDAVYVFAAGLMASESSYVLRPRNLSCELEHPWDDGLSLYNFINSVSLHGLTGNIQFNEGRRTNFKLDLLKLKKEKLRTVGYWTSDTGIHITDMDAFYETHTHNITLTVMTRVVGGGMDGRL